MTRPIHRDELESMIDRQQEFALVEVLSPAEFKEAHLPTARNVPLGPRFAERIQAEIPDKEATVVVYCKDKDCQASPQAANQMEELGYHNVYDYEEGKKDWHDAGLPMAS
jgi:rhodanese-related sulfurtransferase